MLVVINIHRGLVGCWFFEVRTMELSEIEYSEELGEGYKVRADLG